MTPFERMMAGTAASGPVMAQAGTPFDALMSAVKEPPPPKAAPAKPSQAEDAFRFADNIMRMIASGASFGLIDKGAALADSLIWRGTYPENVSRELARSEAFEREYPYVAIPAQIGGGVLSALALGPLAQSVRAPNIVKTTVGGGGAGAAGAFGTSQGDDTGGDVGKGALAGAALGAAIPPVAQAALKGGRGIVNALAGTSPERAVLAQTAERMGIPLTAAQIGETAFPKYMESVLNKAPLVYGSAAREAQPAAFTQALARTIGENTDRLTPEVMARAKGRLGKEFENFAAGKALIADDGFTNRLASIKDEAEQVLTGDELKPIIKQIDNVMGKIANNQITGEVYQALTRRGSPLDLASRNAQSPNVRHYASMVRDALDDALEAVTPSDQLMKMRAIRTQYKNMKTIEDLVEKSTDGIISPALLMNEVRRSYKDMAYRGAGEIGDLARIGQAFLKQQPSSGTSERLGIMALLAGGGASLANPSIAPQAIGGLGAAILGGNLARGAMNSDAYRRLMISNALTPQYLSPEMRALAAQSMTLGGGAEAGRLSSGQ